MKNKFVFIPFFLLSCSANNKLSDASGNSDVTQVGSLKKPASQPKNVAGSFLTQCDFLTTDGSKVGCNTYSSQSSEKTSVDSQTQIKLKIDNEFLVSESVTDNYQSIFLLTPEQASAVASNNAVGVFVRSNSESIESPLQANVEVFSSLPQIKSDKSFVLDLQKLDLSGKVKVKLIDLIKSSFCSAENNLQNIKLFGRPAGSQEFLQFDARNDATNVKIGSEPFKIGDGTVLSVDNLGEFDLKIVADVNYKCSFPKNVDSILPGVQEKLFAKLESSLKSYENIFEIDEIK